MHDFTRLDIYQDSVRWTASVYELTKDFPQSELFGLTSQLRRCAASVPANMAEGAGRGGSKEFARFLRITIGSLCEFEAHLDVAVAAKVASTEATSPLRREARSIRRRVKALERQLSTHGGESDSP